MDTERELEDVARHERSDLERIRRSATPPPGRAESALAARIAADVGRPSLGARRLPRALLALCAGLAAVALVFVTLRELAPQPAGNGASTEGPSMGDALALHAEWGGVDRTRAVAFRVELRAPAPSGSSVSTKFRVYAGRAAPGAEPLLSAEIEGTRWELTEARAAALPPHLLVIAEVYVGFGTPQLLGSVEASFGP